MTRPKVFFIFTAIFSSLFMPITTLANETAGGTSGAENHTELFAITFLFLAILLIVARCGAIVEKFGQPAVLGEIVAGVILGNLGLLGIHWLEPVASNALIAFMAELGVVILLFQIGLESNIRDMAKVGLPAFLVAVIGVIFPFVLATYIVGPWLMPGMDKIAYIFLGATLTATSVGITARVFKDLGVLQMKEAKIVLGAAVIDDVLGLLILAVVSALATTGNISIASIAVISTKALAFLVSSIVVGMLLAPRLGRIFSKIHTGAGMKSALAISFCLTFAYLASLVGLAPIVGAFAAGLLLDPVHFKFFMKPVFIEKLREVSSKCKDAETSKSIEEVIEHHTHKHIDDLIEGVARFVVPIFFIYTGFNVKLAMLFEPSVLLIAFGVTVAAILGKLVSGFGARKVNRLLIGVGMIPRGEVGLIFASIGKGLGVIDEKLFSIVVIMVIVTTLITPPILAYILKYGHEKDKISLEKNIAIT